MMHFSCCRCRGTKSSKAIPTIQLDCQCYICVCSECIWEINTLTQHGEVESREGKQKSFGFLLIQCKCYWFTDPLLVPVRPALFLPEIHHRTGIDCDSDDRFLLIHSGTQQEWNTIIIKHNNSSRNYNNRFNKNNNSTNNSININNKIVKNNRNTMAHTNSAPSTSEAETTVFCQNNPSSWCLQRTEVVVGTTGCQFSVLSAHVYINQVRKQTER